jgi:hypothetical protein
MRYRTKLAMAMALLAIFTGGLVLALYYYQSRAILFQRIQSQVLSIAATAATQVDGDLLEQIRTQEDESSPAYAAIQRGLRAMRDANRRGDVQVRFVYDAPAGGKSAALGLRGGFAGRWREQVACRRSRGFCQRDWPAAQPGSALC